MGHGEWLRAVCASEVPLSGVEPVQARLTLAKHGVVWLGKAFQGVVLLFGVEIEWQGSVMPGEVRLSLAIHGSKLP